MTLLMRLLAGVIAVASVAAHGHSGRDDAGSAAFADAHGDRTLYLAVRLNGRDTGMLARAIYDNGHVLMRYEDLVAVGVGVDVDRGQPRSGSRAAAPPDALIDLDAIDGLDYTYDAASQELAIQVDDAMRVPFVYGSGSVEPGKALSGRGVVLNYDAWYDNQRDLHSRHSQLALWNELRVFNPSGVFTNTGAFYAGGRSRDYVRFDTWWERSNPATMRTWRVGDMISSSQEWSRPVRMGGVQWSRNFDLRPDLVTFPIPELDGTAVVPSTVDLFINNVRRATTQVPDGPFVLADAPGITGAGMATVVMRDALGRTTSSTRPLYVDRRLLAQGLSAYSVEAGFLRRHYGLESFRYDSKPALSASGRHGISDSLTLEGHMESTRGLVNAGVGALARLGMAGVVNAAIAHSAGKGTGSQVSLGYQSIQPRFSLDVQTTRTFGRYRDLGSVDAFPVPRRRDRATLTLPFGGSQSLAFSYVGYRMPGFEPSRIGSVAYTARLGQRASMSMSAYKDFGPMKDKGFFLNLSVALDSRTHAAGYAGRQNGSTVHNASVMRTPPYDGGWGWGVQSGGSGGAQWQQAQLDFRGRAGDVTAMARRMDGRNSVAVNASGSLVVMDGTAVASRHIHDSFALVSTDGVGDVPVLHENRRVGKTNRSGHYLLPDLNPYQRNAVGIDGLDLPADIRVATDKQVVVPQARSGVLVEFPIAPWQAAQVILNDAAGQAVPAGARVTHQESGVQTVVGYDGLTFIDGLKRDNHLDVQYGSQRCHAQFAFQPPGDGRLPTTGPVVCIADE